MQQVDIVCVVFEGDVRLLELQLVSIDRLFDLDTLGTYWLIPNGEADGFEAGLRGFVDRLRPALRDKVRILPASTLATEKLGGWRGQQVIKLLVSRRIAALTYLVLDAKNHFIRPASAADFFRDGKALTLFERPSPAMQYLLVASASYFGISLDEAMAEAMPTITPYLMYTDMARALLDEVEKREGMPFARAFLINLKGFGEFLLYYAYLRWRGEIAGRYVNGPRTCITLFAKWPEEAAVIGRVLDGVSRPEVNMFGLHRLRLPILDREHKQRIAQMWQVAGIATADEAEYYLEPQSSS